MQPYRLYFLDAVGSFVERLDTMAANDGDAVTKALGLAEGRTIEMWQRERLVGRIYRGEKRLPPDGLFQQFCRQKEA